MERGYRRFRVPLGGLVLLRVKRGIKRFSGPGIWLNIFLPYKYVEDRVEVSFSMVFQEF